MKRTLLIGSLTLVAAALAGHSANAQDTLKSAGTVARAPSYTSLLSSIEATPTATDKVKQRTNVTADQIRVVDANSVIGANQGLAIMTAFDKHKDHITELRAALAANPVYTAALAAHQAKPTVNNVMAVDILADGDILVYFRK